MNRREFGQSLAAIAAVPQGANRPVITAAGSLTDVPGIRVGHFTDTRRPTGCTAILFDAAYAAGVDYNGSAPGESQVVMLQPVSPVERIHALYLTGGGIFGLAAHGGVMRFLEERKVGFDWGTPDLRIPIVVSAVITISRSAIPGSGRMPTPPTRRARRRRPARWPRGTSAPARARRWGRCTAAAV